MDFGSTFFSLSIFHSVYFENKAHVKSFSLDCFQQFLKKAAGRQGSNLDVFHMQFRVTFLPASQVQKLSSNDVEIQQRNLLLIWHNKKNCLKKLELLKQRKNMQQIIQKKNFVIAFETIIVSLQRTFINKTPGRTKSSLLNPQITFIPIFIDKLL